jgi:spore coat polysaccharide biosynthesis predicted glycosyltransferase SpsG
MNPKKKYVLVVTEYSEVSGFGNLIRCLELANKFSMISKTQLFVLTDFESRCTQITSEFKNYEIKFHTNPEQLVESASGLDYAILDCQSWISEEIARRIKVKFPSSNVTALDSESDCAYFDFRISLFDRTLKTFKSTSRNHAVGIEYAIISPRVKTIQKRERIPEIIVKFSGKGSSQLDLTKEIIQEQAEALNLRVSVIDNSSDARSGTDFEAQGKFLSRLAECSLYVGSGVTTLFESSLLETPTIFVGSNDAERQFASAISKVHSVHTLNPTEPEYKDELSSLISQAGKSMNFEELVPRVGIDYLGAQRIMELVLQS